jgi:uncharacterized membrane protein YraQ (UPF0718 family)
MSKTAIIINAIALACLIFCFLKDRTLTLKSLKMALRSFFKILPTVLIIIIIIGLILGFLPPEKISYILGETSGPLGVVFAALLGSLLHIPSLISFPLAASLLEVGASITVAAVFITTLTMIGTVTLPMEMKMLGKKFALLRNGLSFIMAVIIAIIMGAIL